MATDLVTRTYNSVVTAMIEDGYDDVERTATGLLVRGKRFAFLDGIELVVQLPQPRASDLKERGIADIFAVDDEVSETWVRVSDLELWPELMRESHAFVAEPPVGGQS